MKRLLLFSVFLVFSIGAWSQSFAFGVKGGLTLGLQKWSGMEMDPLAAYHGVVFIESLSEENKYALFAQAGYHVKGSAIRNRNFIDRQGNFFRPPAYTFKFNNISLTLGAKQKLDFKGNTKVYYLFGIRGDYNINTNLDQYTQANQLYPGFFPFDSRELIRPVTYGVTLGGGFEIPIADMISALIEFNINPDFSYQYIQYEIDNVTDPYTGNTRTIPDRQIRNLTFEVTVGFRFLRIVEYVD